MSEPDQEFLEIFRDEASERLDRIVDTLLALENGSAAAGRGRLAVSRHAHDQGRRGHGRPR